MDSCRSILILCALAGLAAPAAGQPAAVVTDLRAALEAPDGARGAREVEVHAPALIAAAAAGHEIALEAAGRLVVVSPRRAVSRDGGGLSWFGATPDGGRVVLSLVAGRLMGRIATPAGLVLIEPIGDRHVAYEPGPYPEGPDDALTAHSDGSPPERALPELLFPDELHLLIAYTPAVAAVLGPNLPVFLRSAEDVVTDVLQNSEVPFRARLVHAHPLTYTESGNMSTDLSRIRSTADGFMDEVHDLRDAYAADLVALIVQNASNNCGVAYLMDPVRPEFAPNGFSTTLRSCAIGNLTFPHELGHNIGLRHDRFVDQSNTPFPYSHGFVNDDSLGPGRPGIRTTLAYNDQCTSQGGTCTRVPYYSAPNLSFGGQVIGDSLLAHNARAAAFSLPTVAAFRAAALLATDDGDTGGQPLFLRPDCPDPGDLSLCVTGAGVPYQSRSLQAAADGLYHVRAEAVHEALLLIYEGGFDPGQPLLGLVAYAEPDSSAPALRRLLASRALSAGGSYAVVTAGISPTDSGPYDLEVYGPSDGGVVVAADEGPQGGDVRIGRPAPNPFTGSTAVTFAVASTQRIRVDVFDVLGRHVGRLLDETVPAGAARRVDFHGADLAPGAYAIRIVGSDGIASVRVTRAP